ncbi:MAG: FAD-dependent oxidoreductase [Candidatus Hydrogenedentes bacterium]|nr:FAD-dependent oxidoreductase [Candidatus Hydrogenedentota bacterium]
MEQYFADAVAEWRRLETSELPVFFVGAATCGRAAGAGEVLDALRGDLARRGLGAEVVEVGCLGPCFFEPLVIVQKPGLPRVCYGNIGVDEMLAIVERFVLGGDPCAEWALGKIGDGVVNGVDDLDTHPLMKRQVRRLLHNCGAIDPENAGHYLANGGYKGFLRALEIGPENVIEEVKNAGLRGRGGAGFPTWRKWSFARGAEGSPKYLICNADEGDPGAFMNRSLIEGDPHAVLEGMLIAGFAIGASQGYVYCRAEYPLAIHRLEIAIAQMRDMGLLGENILGSGFNFDLKIKMGAGAFVCGEETALIASIEGQRGMPRPRPPFPPISGLWGKPTVIQNVESLGNLPLILKNGAEWFSEYGSENSKGTKTFALAGKIKRTGLVEVPLGTKLLDIIYDVGGGTSSGKAVKAVQTGGPSGGCIPAARLDLPVDYESLTQAGTIMGSGGMIVLDEDNCMVDIARYFLTFTQAESCGKCVPCRVGTRAMLGILDKIVSGRAEMADLDRLEEIAYTVKNGSLCGLGQTAANPVLTTLRYFRDEYEAHVKEKRCPAGVCPALVVAPCMCGCPAGVYIPGFVSLVGERRYDEALRMHRERNPFASVCARVCFHACEGKCRRSALDSPVSIRSTKRFMVEREKAPQLPEVRENPAAAARKVAVIGAGPAGLTCAFFLARMGYRPVIFEAEPKPGGMLVQAIPAYRLPRTELDREIDMITGLGAALKTNCRLGRDFTLQSLRDDGYEAVFLGMGMPKGQNLGIPGEEDGGAVDALGFLKEYNVTGKAQVGKKVAVIGGGNAAVDAARTALRLGAEEVTILYRRTRNEMPAYAEEIDEAENEGVRLWTLALPLEVVKENGAVKSLRCQRAAQGEFDLSGRRKSLAVEGDFFTLEVDQVIAAIGQEPEAGVIPGELGLKQSRNGAIQVDPVTGQTGVEWLFAGGDNTTGPASVVEAIGAGERAAVGMDLFLSGERHDFWRARPHVDTHFDPLADPDMTPRAPMELLPVEKRRGNFEEVELPYTEEQAVMEARRCLRCDFCAEEH